MKIAVISDTHGLLRPEAAEIIAECDAVIHGGDINSQRVLDEIQAAAGKNTPLFVVRGNNDRKWAEHIPETLEFELAGKRFFVIHNRRLMPHDVSADIVIFGHTHKYFEERTGGTLCLNPGSAGRRRFSLPATMAVLEINGDDISVERIDIEVQQKPVPKDTRRLIDEIMKRMDRGEGTVSIAKRLGIDPGFVMQTAMIRVTHPGVDAEGIMNRLEVNGIYG